MKNFKFLCYKKHQNYGILNKIAEEKKMEREDRKRERERTRATIYVMKIHIKFYQKSSAEYSCCLLKFLQHVDSAVWAIIRSGQNKREACMATIYYIHTYVHHEYHGIF